MLCSEEHFITQASRERRSVAPHHARDATHSGQPAATQAEIERIEAEEQASAVYISSASPQYEHAGLSSPREFPSSLKASSPQHNKTDGPLAPPPAAPHVASQALL